MRKKPTYISAIASVALVLFILGFFGILALHGRKLVSLFKEKVDIWIELRQNTSEAEIARLVSEVRAKEFVKPESITFITKEQAAAQMKADLGEESLLDEYPDMLREIIRFNVKAEYLNDEALTNWREALKQDSVVVDLYFEAASTGNISNNIEKLGWFTLILGIFLIFAAVSLIHNTIRLALYANRFIIKNQELVGASQDFIIKPYMRRGILNGVISGIIAIAALIGLLQWAMRQMPEIKTLQDNNGLFAICLGLLFMGILISGLSTWLVVKKFLRMRIDDLY